MKNRSSQKFQRIIFTAVLFFLVSTQMNAQTYFPGGVGNANLSLWLDANDPTTITKNGSNQISNWKDKSSTSSVLSVAQSTLGNEPVFTSSGINSKPSISFTGSSVQYFSLQASSGPAANTYFQGYSNFSHFSVYNQTNNTQTTLYGKELIWKTQLRPSNAGFNFYASGSGTGWGTSLSTTGAITMGSNVLLSAIYNSSGNYNAYAESGSQGSTPLGNQVLGTNANNFQVGTYNSGGEPLTGQIGEILLFNTNVTNTQRVIIENYLSTKWGVALTANNYYTAPTTTSYLTNLVGIGYTSNTDNFLTNSATSTDGLGFSSGTGASDFLNTTGYVMAAHNGQANTTMTNISIAGIGTGLNRWNRSWYLQTSGGNANGNITFNFNFNSYNSTSLPSSTSNYYLLYNATDGSFATGTNTVIAVSNAASGSNAAFVVNAKLLPLGYYSIMWSSSSTQLIIPSTSTVCAGSNTVFTALTTSGFNYQWQVNNGSGFVNVPASDPGGAVYSGATSAALSITGVTASMSGYTYQVILIPSSGPNVVLGTPVLTVNAIPTVAAITGSSQACISTIDQLNNATAGGVWTSSNTSVATINASGQVTGLVPGSSTITYTVSNSGCSAASTFNIVVANHYYYPGGLGNANLNLWLDANDASTITKNGSNQISNWNDKSSGSSVLSVGQSTTSNEPVFTTSGINARPSVSFNGSTPQYFSLQASSGAAANTYFQGNSTMSHFAVYMQSNNAQTTLYGKETVWKLQLKGGNTGLNLLASGNGSGWGTSLSTSNTLTMNTGQLISSIYNASSNYDNYTASSNHASTALGGQILGTNTNNFTVGCYNSGAEPLTGQVGEILIYNTNVSATQRVIVENYLSAKWGLALTANINYAPPTSTTYTTNLVAIGYTSNTDNFLTDVAGSTDGLGFSSGTGATDFLNTAGYVMAAHNGQSNIVNYNPTLSNVPANSYVWNRSWYFNRSGGNSTGNITMNFNFNDYNCSTPNTSNFYAVLYNATDGTFSSGTNVLLHFVSQTISGNSASFVMSASSLSTGYYTLVYNQNNLLPIVLENFSVEKQGGSALLHWTSSDEINSSHFNIQRSADGKHFNTIGRVNAAGNSSQNIDYSFTDYSPLNGWNYYRLQMVDIDGNTANSSTARVDFGNGSTALSIYPNPVSSLLYINSPNYHGPASIQLINTNGQTVQAFQTSALGSTPISLENMANGVYFVKIIGESINTIQKIIKQ